MFGDASLFRCDKENKEKRCYTNEYFTKHQHAIDFLEFQLKVTDDCAPFSGLAGLSAIGVNISHVTGTCHETQYQITPYQDYAGCDGHSFNNSDGEIVSFVNPLYGKPVYITVQVDEENPIVRSGYNHHDSDDVVYSVHGNGPTHTLFHYSSKRLFRDAHFFYNIEVRLQLSAIDNLSAFDLQSYHVNVTQENCPQDVKVNIVVESNEFHDGKMLKMVEYRDAGFNSQAKIFYSPRRWYVGYDLP